MTERPEPTRMADAEIETECKRIAAWWQNLTPEQQEANQQKLLDMVFVEGTLTVPPKDVPRTVEATIIDGMDYRPPAERAKLRPANYLELGPREQWEIDKQLGILDWDGTA